MNTLKMKHLWRTLMLTVAMVFALSPLRSQVVGISGVNTPLAPVCSGEDFTVTFNYYWANFPSPTGLTEIEITVPVPAGLQPATNTAPGGINPFYGTVTYIGGISAPTAIRYNIIADLSVPSGGGTVQVNLKFPAGVTCDGAKKCFSASTKYKQNNIWSNPVSTPDTFCVTAKAQNHWTVDKDVMWCRWDSLGRNVLYRVIVQNNLQANNWDPTCSINIPTYTLTDQMGTGATFAGIVASPPGFTPSSWTGATTSGSTITFTGGPVGGLNVLGRYYYVYFWIRYPNSQFDTGATSVINKVNLSAFDTCGNKIGQVDSVRTNLCAKINLGSLTKTFTQTMGTPPNPVYFPTLSPGCCGAYTLVYKNTGTVDQPNLTTIDRVPDNVNFGSIRTVITEPGMTCEVRYSTDNGASYPLGNIIGTYTTVNTSGHLISSIPTSATHIRWTYGGSVLPVGYTLTNYISFCVRNDYGRGNFQGNDNGTNNIVEPGEIIRNIAVTRQNGVRLDTINHDLTINPIAPKIVAHKMFIGNCVGGTASAGGPWYPGQIVRYRMAIANIGSQTANNCSITDLLPQYLSYVGNPTYVWYTATSIPGVNNNMPPCDTTSQNPPTAAVGTISVSTAPWGSQQKVTWNFTALPKDCDGFPTYLIIDFDVKISGPAPDPVALAGQYCNSYNFVATEVPTPGHNSNSVCFTITTDPQFVGDKSVGLTTTGPWSNSASIGAGQQGHYKIKIKNTGNTPLAQLSLLDILPQIGDKSILRYGGVFNNRNSRYGITLSGPVTITGASTLTLGQITSNYSTTPEPFKRSDVGLGFPSFGVPIVDPAGAPISSGWTTTLPSTGAKAFKVAVNSGINLLPGENLEFTVQFQVADNAPNDSIACNSFAYQAKPTGLPSYNGGVLVSEKGPVCVTAIADSCDFLCNEDFEIFNGQVTDFEWLSEDSVDCWETTASDNSIEIWNEVGMSVPAYSGTYFAELNATEVGTLYQTFTLTTAQTVSVGFAHRGRYANPDVMKVKINGIDLGGPYSDNNSGGNTPPYVNGWRYYTTPPITLPIGVHTLSFVSVSSGGGVDDGGNFLDSITVHCAEPTSVDGDCCDSASFSPYLGPDDQTEGKTVTIYNVKQTKITWVDIQYYQCPITPGSLLTTANGLTYVRGGTPGQVVTGTTTFLTPQSDWFNLGTNYVRLPKLPPSGANTTGQFPGTVSQDKIFFNISLPWDVLPTTWCIRLIIHHEGGDSCVVDLPSWDPDSATNKVGVTQTNPAPGNVHSVTLGVNWTQFTGIDLGYVLVTPLDTTDEVLGGTGGVWESSTTHDAKSPVSNFVQSKRGALFSLYNGKGLDSKITVFISTPQKDKKPRIKWSLYDKNASILSTDTIQTNGTVSIVNPPTIAPGTNDVAINSIIPNPASGSVMFNYTLGASEAVRIELFDPLGKSVGVIADGFQTQGLHQLNYHVGTLAEGTYYLRLTTRFGRASAVVKVIH